MATPTITFNNGTGSDTAASGAGPATAVSGTAASFTGSVVTLDGAPDLSAFSATTWVLWMLTSVGRQFFDLSAADNVAKTVTTVNAPAGTATGRTWGIGGRRKTVEDANSRLLFSADAKANWTIQLEDDQPALTSALNCAAAGSTSGWITFQGNSTTTRRLLTTATNNVSLITAGLSYWKVKNLAFQSTAATRTTSYGISASAAASGVTWVENCVFGDATNKLQSGLLRSGSATASNVIVINNEFKNCLGYGLDNGSGSISAIVVVGNFVHDNGGTAGLYLQFGAGGAYAIVEDNLIVNNAGAGILVNNASQSNVLHVRNNTIHGNTSDGLKVQLAVNFQGALILNNQITKNGGWGINYTPGSGDAVIGLVDWNDFGTGTTANTSGAVTGFTLGPNSLSTDPGYTNAAGNDYSLAAGSASRAAGWPPSALNVGAGGSATKTYPDIGAAQHPDPAGGTTYIFQVEG